MRRLTVDGKHLCLDGQRVFLKAVTYGPFPAAAGLSDEIEFSRIRAAGFHAIRTYLLPDRAFLDLAQRYDLLVIPTLDWGQGTDFLKSGIFSRAHQKMARWLTNYGGHASLGALLVGNEIPSEIARWIGPATVRAKLDELIDTARRLVPDLPVAYANFPTTEYLEPLHASFTAFNLYLEDEAALGSYLPRLHHLAGDRPVLLTEFGLDTQRHPESEQASLLAKAHQLAFASGFSGITTYAWSDHWLNGGKTMIDWSFGLTRRDGTEKAALEVLTHWQEKGAPVGPRISAIVCTRNGGERLPACLASLKALSYPDFEIIIVNDGSADGTREILNQEEGIHAIHLEPSGLSAARNAGAEAATGSILAFTDDDCVVDKHWLSELAIAYRTTSHASIGGPNLSPVPDSLALALTTAAPGAPTHVMLNDTEAEHLPGCHLSVRKEAFEKIGGFDPIFHRAGDDVDFCWRLRDAGYTLGFRPSSFVWHHRRSTIRRYLRQQTGYGHAEALLFKKHPQRFDSGGVRWEGVVYQGSALGVQTGDFIYAGPTGQDAYQSLALSRQPQRGLHPDYDNFRNRLFLKLISHFSISLRQRERLRFGGPGKPPCSLVEESTAPSSYEIILTPPDGRGRYHLYQYLQDQGWQPSSHPAWDLEKNGLLLFAATELIEDPYPRTFVRVTSKSVFPTLESWTQKTLGPR